MALQSPQLDYSIKRMDSVPSYKFAKIFQQTGGQDMTITTSASESIFELPARVINLARSSLRYTHTPTTTGNINWMFRDAIAHIRQIQLYTRGGVFLCDLNNVDKFSSVALKVDTKIEDAQVADAGTDGLLSDAFGCIAGKRGLTNVTTATVITTASGATVPGEGTAATMTALAGLLTATTTPTKTYENNHRYGTAVAANDNVNEPQYLRVDATGVHPISNMDVPLSQFKDTILALDKDLYFGEVMLLKVTWNDYNAHGFISTSATDPTAGTAAVLAGNIALSKLALYCALEMNPVISAGLISAVQTGGFVTNIPYVYGYKNNPGANASQNVSIRMNRVQGKYLKKVYHILYNPTETLGTRYNHSNLDGTICTSYYTAVDNSRRQEFDVKIADNDDWLLHKPYLKNTMLNRMETYRFNWFVLDKFDDEFYEEDGVIDSGLSLDTERKWDFMGTTSEAAHNHYTFAVVSRALMITPQGIMLA